MTPPVSARSHACENLVFVLVVPVSLVLVAWVWFGRAFFGAGGWFLLVFALTVAPALVVLLGLTTILALTQRRPASAGWLTPLQTWLHVALWCWLFVFGLCWVDFGDAPDSTQSVLSLAVDGGPAVRELSMTLAFGAGALAAATWIGLLAALIKGNAEAKRLHAPMSPYPHQPVPSQPQHWPQEPPYR